MPRVAFSTTTAGLLAIVLANHACARPNPAFDALEVGLDDTTAGTANETPSTTMNAPEATSCRALLWASSHDGTLSLLNVRTLTGTRVRTLPAGALALATDAQGVLWWFPLSDEDPRSVWRIDPFDEELEPVPLELHDLPSPERVAAAAFDDAGRLWAMSRDDVVLFRVDLDNGSALDQKRFETALGQDGDILADGEDVGFIDAGAIWRSSLTSTARSLVAQIEGDAPAVVTGAVVLGDTTWISDVDGDVHAFDGTTLRWRFNLGGPINDLSEVRGNSAQCDAVARLSQ